MKLRKGVKFHNGEEFNAEAVKFTLDRVRVSGATQCLEASRRSRMCARDPHTVHIVTKQPDPLLPARLAQWGAQMLPPGYVKEAGAEGLPSRRSAPVRTGSASGARTTRSYSRRTRLTGASAEILASASGHSG